MLPGDALGRDRCRTMWVHLPNVVFDDVDRAIDRVLFKRERAARGA
jgi:hypothetical protein